MLFKTDGPPQLPRIEAKCPKCKKINYFDDAVFHNSKRVKVKA